MLCFISTSMSALLVEARETSRRDRASAAADSERLAKRLDEQNEDFVQRGRAALAKLSDASEPAARGTELTLREIEEESGLTLRSDELRMLGMVSESAY